MMSRNSTNRGHPASMILSVSALSLLLLAGCASTSEPSQQLQSARQAYQQVEGDEEAARSATEALERSNRALEEAERLLADGADMEIVDHHAYLAEKYALVASEQAEQARLQDQIEQAKQKRQELRLKIERAKAERAQRKAQQAQREAEQLKARLSDLQAKQTERGIVLTLGDVLFDFDEANLKPGGEQAARRVAKFMHDYPDRRIRIEGYTDSKGPESYNQKLSQRRAQSVKEAIVSQDIDSSRIVTQGYGEAYPVASNDNRAGRQRNRRVEIVISDAEGQLESR